MLIKYEFGLGLAQKNYPDGPSRIFSDKVARKESGFLLEVGDNPPLRIAWADDYRELLAFAQVHGWRIEE